MNDFFAIYAAMLADVPDVPIEQTLSGRHWTGVRTSQALGLAMTIRCDSIPPVLPRPYEGQSLQALAQGITSWNLSEAGFAMAAINAGCNTPSRLAQWNAGEPFQRYCTGGIDLSGKRIGVVGHLNMPDFVRRQAKQVLILERSPQPGDYPDSACEVLLPLCDVVIITASTLVNKTLPRLLQLCAGAVTILTGPTCPLCPALLDMGIDRLAGLVVENVPEMEKQIRANRPGSPYPLGQPFLLTRDRL